MTPDQVFSFANAAVLPAWLLLICLPRWQWTRRLVPTFFALPLAVLYLWILASKWGSGGGFGSLADVQLLFESPWLLVGGWVHYLVFDLFIGAWEVRDSQRCGLPHWLVIPALFLTFMLGPIGLLAYWGLRAGLRRRLLLEEA